MSHCVDGSFQLSYVVQYLATNSYICAHELLLSMCNSNGKQLAAFPDGVNKELIPQSCMGLLRDH